LAGTSRPLNAKKRVNFYMVIGFIILERNSTNPTIPGKRIVVI
jgi:hypothetical protein